VTLIIVYSWVGLCHEFKCQQKYIPKSCYMYKCSSPNPQMYTF